MIERLRSHGFALAALLALARAGAAQCLEWTPTFPGGTTNARVLCFAVHDEGSGAALYAGGDFGVIGGTTANFVGRWNGLQWSALADGMNDSVLALASFDDGRGRALYAGGEFTSAGGVPASHIAKWDGASWSELGGGIEWNVDALAVYDDGSGAALYAAGNFTLAGATSVSNIARWDGSTWTALGAGLDAHVYALTVFDDGNGPALYAGGDFTQAGGTGAAHIAKWDRSGWSNVSGGMNATVYALETFDDGTGSALYAGGQFQLAGGVTAQRIARWNGSSWSALGIGTNDWVRGLHACDDGSGPALYACGNFQQAGGVNPAHFVARWRDGAWSAVGSGVSNWAYALTSFDSGAGPSLIMGGEFTSASQSSLAARVARWDGQNWTGLGGGPNAEVLALATVDEGSTSALYAAGRFTSVGNVAASRIARWDGSSWSALASGVSGIGTGLPGATPFIAALAYFDNGSGPALYAGGLFAFAGGVNARSIAKWDGASWSALGVGLPGSVYALCVFDDGTGPALYVGGEFTLAGFGAQTVVKWKGSSWTPLTNGTGAGYVNALVAFDDGTGARLYAGGKFPTIAGVSAANIARWDGAGWTALGSGVNDAVRALTVFDDGSGPALFAGGEFLSAGSSSAPRIARWDGAQWSSPGGANNLVNDLMVFDDGSGAALYAGGQFTVVGGVGANRIARWNGTVWSALGTGLNTTVGALAGYDDGSGGGADLYLGGLFSQAGGMGASFMAQWLGCNDPITAFCFGDGQDSAVTTPCPCANFGAAGHGCGNSEDAGGALLMAHGTTSPDTLTLTATGIPLGSGSIFLQGSAVASAGIVFGDGVRCAAGQLIRLGVKFDTDFDAATSFGPSVGDLQLSLAGAVAPGATYSYQTYYRNPDASFCPPATFNITNALAIEWP